MKYIYLSVQIFIATLTAIIIVWCGKILLTEPTKMYTVEIYNIGGFNKETWKGDTKEKIWLEANYALTDKPKAFDFNNYVKVPINGDIKNGYYRDPFVNSDGTLDYFTTGINHKEDAKFMLWLTQVGADLQGLSIIGIKEKESIVFLRTGNFTTWVSPKNPMAIPIPQEYWQIMQDKAPEQIKKGKLLLQLIRVEEDAIWFKIPLMRTPLKVVRKPLDNTVLKNILKPL